MRWQVLIIAILCFFYITFNAVGHGGKGNKTIMLSTSASFSPDGKRVAVSFQKKDGSYHGPMWKIWDVSKGKEDVEYWHNIPPNKKYPDTSLVAFLPDGKRLLTVGHDMICQIWDSKKSELIKEFAISNGESTSKCVLSQDGKFLLNGYSLWDVDNGKLFGKAEQTKNRVLNSLIAPDGSWAYFNCASTPKDPVASFFYEFKAKRTFGLSTVKFPIEPKQIKSIIPFLLSPDGRDALAWKNEGLDGAIILCDSKTFATKKEISPLLQREPVTRARLAVFTPDGRNLVTYDRIGSSGTLIGRDVEKNVERWQVNNLKELNILGLIAASPNNRHVLLVGNHFKGADYNRDCSRLTILSATTGKVESRLDADNVFPEN